MFISPLECRYVSMDLVGHGLSSHRPPGTFYSFLDYVADVHKVVDGVCVSAISLWSAKTLCVSSVMRQWILLFNGV